MCVNFASIAQMVEHLICNQEASGSIPDVGSKLVVNSSRNRRSKMFTVNLHQLSSAYDSRSFECAMYEVRKAEEADPAGVNVVIKFQDVPEAGGTIRYIELKSGDRAYVMNRYGNTHQIIDGNHKSQ